MLRCMVGLAISAPLRTAALDKKFDQKSTKQNGAGACRAPRNGRGAAGEHGKNRHAAAPRGRLNKTTFVNRLQDDGDIQKSTLGVQ